MRELSGSPYLEPLRALSSGVRDLDDPKSKGAPAAASAAQADVEAMTGKMMDKIRRPQPSLTMPPKRPFASGCSPATGFQALAITALGPGEDGSGKRRDTATNGVD